VSRGALAAALCIPRLPGPPQRMCPTLVWGRRGAVCASLACRGRRGACVQRLSGAAAALCSHPALVGAAAAQVYPAPAAAAAAHVSNACLGPPRRCVRIPRMPGPPRRMCPTLVWGRRGAVFASRACRGRRSACVQRLPGPPRRCVRIPRLSGPPRPRIVAAAVIARCV